MQAVDQDIKPVHGIYPRCGAHRSANSRRSLLLLSVLFFLLGGLLFYVSLPQIPATWASLSLKKAFRASNEVEVTVLGDTKKHPTSSVYTTKLDGIELAKVSIHKLSKEQAKELCGIFQEHLIDSSGGAACHDPGYLLRFATNGHTNATFSLCLHCSNLEIEPIPWCPVLVSLYQRRLSELKLADLEAFLSKAIPSPPQ